MMRVLCVCVLTLAVGAEESAQATETAAGTWIVGTDGLAGTETDMQGDVFKVLGPLHKEHARNEVRGLSGHERR
jgi:hypothetical protein